MRYSESNLPLNCHGRCASGFSQLCSHPCAIKETECCGNLKMAVSYVHTCQTHETYLPDNSCPKHFQLNVISHHCLLEGYVGTGHHVSEACFVHVTVAVVLGFY